MGFAPRPALEHWFVRRAHSGRTLRECVWAADVLSGVEERAVLASTHRRPLPPQPLVTVTITTFGRPEVLLRNAVASVLAQSYQNLEVVIVGDGCPSEEELAIQAGLTDPRCRFVNLGRRWPYPNDPDAFWRAKGNAARNVGLALARGDWIYPLDDDDALHPDCLELHVGAARESNADVVHCRALFREDDSIVGGPLLAGGNVTTGSYSFDGRLSFLRHNPSGWRYGIAGDWDLVHRFERLPLNIRFLDRVLCFHPGPLADYDLTPLHAG